MKASFSSSKKIKAYWECVSLAQLHKPSEKILELLMLVLEKSGRATVFSQCLSNITEKPEYYTT